MREEPNPHLSTAGPLNEGLLMCYSRCIFAFGIPGLVGNRFLIDFQAQDFVLSFRILFLVPPSTHLKKYLFLNLHVHSFFFLQGISHELFSLWAAFH